MTTNKPSDSDCLNHNFEQYGTRIKLNDHNHCYRLFKCTFCGEEKTEKYRYERP